MTLRFLILYKCIDSYLSNPHESMEEKNTLSEWGMITEDSLLEILDNYILDNLCNLMNIDDEESHKKLDEWLLQCSTIVQGAAARNLDQQQIYK